MRIAWVNTNLITCGGIITNFEYVKELRKRGIKAYMFSDTRNEELEKEYGISHLRTEWLETWTDEDVIIANRWEQCEKLEKYKGRKIQFVQGDDMFHWAENDWIEKLKKARSDKNWELIGVSKFCLENWGRGTVIPNGISQRFFEFTENGTRDIDILIEGNNEDNKNIDLAVSLCKSAYPDNSKRIVWLGRETRPINGVETVTNPPQKEIPKIYQKSKVLVKLSKREGFCLPILEAMACGCAVVTWDMGGNDFCRDGENCTMIPMDRVDGIYIKKTLEDEEYRKKLVHEGLWTARWYTWKRATDTLLDYLKKPL